MHILLQAEGRALNWIRLYNVSDDRHVVS